MYRPFTIQLTYLRVPHIVWLGHHGETNQEPLEFSIDSTYLAGVMSEASYYLSTLRIGISQKKAVNFALQSLVSYRQKSDTGTIRRGPCHRWVGKFQVLIMIQHDETTHLICWLHPKFQQVYSPTCLLLAVIVAAPIPLFLHYDNLY